MSETNQFQLPLLEAAQAQKHVTVNESLARLDAVAQMRFVSISETVPPLVAAEGLAFAIPSGAVNDWDGHVGEVAVFANGGWVFFTPLFGWRAWVADAFSFALFDGAEWRLSATSLSENLAGTFGEVIEFDHVLTAGAFNHTSYSIGDSDQVIGVTGRVLTAITGSGVTSWNIGVDGAETRYGATLSLGANSWLRGMTSQPLTYWGGIPLRVEANGGDFDGGSVRLAVHIIRLEPPG